MGTYTIGISANYNQIRTWAETNRRRAMRLARQVARDSGQTADRAYVMGPGGDLLYALHRRESRWYVGYVCGRGFQLDYRYRRLAA